MDANWLALCHVSPLHMRVRRSIHHQVELVGFICESFAFQVPAPKFVLAMPVLKLRNEDFSRSPMLFASSTRTRS